MAKVPQLEIFLLAVGASSANFVHLALALIKIWEAYPTMDIF